MQAGIAGVAGVRAPLEPAQAAAKEKGWGTVFTNAMCGYVPSVGDRAKGKVVKSRVFVMSSLFSFASSAINRPLSWANGGAGERRWEEQSLG